MSALPSSVAIDHLRAGAPGAVGEVVRTTLGRALLIAPGIMLGSYVRRRKVSVTETAIGSVAAASAISLFIWIYSGRHE